MLREELDAESLDAISGGLTKGAKWGIGGGSAVTGGGILHQLTKKRKSVDNDNGIPKVETYGADTATNNGSIASDGMDSESEGSLSKAWNKLVDKEKV